jgi:hypothetical protein
MTGKFLLFMVSIYLSNQLSSLGTLLMMGTVDDGYYME